MNISIALIILSSISITICLFMVTYFLFIRNENKLQDLSLGFLLLAITLRISKSIFYYIFPDLSATGVAFGFLGFASMGPLLLFYFRFSSINSSHFKRTDVLHFLFPTVGFFIISLLDIQRNNLYLTAKLSLGIYLVVIGYRYLYNKDLVDGKTKWHTVLFFTNVCLLAVFSAQFFAGTIESYTIGTGVASLIFYVLFFYILKTPRLIRRSNTSKIPEELRTKIIETIEDNKIYKQPSITLAQFSEVLDTPSYIVSKATSLIYNKTFPEVINSYRIKEITQKLKEPNHVNDKIEDLAYDVGFNTSSAFYSAFKKETSMTPRAYQKLAATEIIQSN